jgi:hypothetical protein
MAKISPEPMSGCWLWIGYCGRGGYARFGFNTAERQTLIDAHRASWMLFRGEIPRGIRVCHLCDVRSCVNPEHLFLGTALDNARDMIAKGRGAYLDKHPMRKLSWADVREIRSLHQRKSLQQDIADRFGITQTTVSNIVHGHTWREL